MFGALLYDDKDQFLRVILRDNFDDEEMPSAHCLLRFIFKADAIKIGIAAFNGEFKDILDPEDVFCQEMTRLHFAAIIGSPTLFNYFIERGDNVDLLCDNQRMNVKQATTLEIALESIESGYSTGSAGMDGPPWSTHKSIFELLVYLCNQMRKNLEIIRLVVQNTSNKEHVRRAFIDCANNGQLLKLTALFLAVPDMFLSYNVSLRDSFSSVGILNLVLNSLDKRTNTEEALLLLFDVFTIIGDKLVAFFRLEDNYLSGSKQHIIAFLLDELAHRKPGVSSPDDYYLRFFKPVRPEVYELEVYPRDVPGTYVFDSDDPFPLLSFRMKRKDINVHYINRMFRNFTPKHEEADLLYRAIDNKLSSMSTFHDCFQDVANRSRNCAIMLPLHTSSKPWINRKFTQIDALANKANLSAKLQYFFSFVNLSNSLRNVKHFIK